MKRLLLIAFCATSFLCSHVNAAVITDFEDVSEPGLPGRLYVPPEASESARPLILYLHGAGEQGDDNSRQVGPHINNLLSIAKENGAFVYAPQAVAFSGIHNWNDVNRIDQVKGMLDKIMMEQNTDQRRVYVTGISMGGGGTWNMASRYPDTFAAAAPIAGVKTDDSFDPTNLIGKPTWAYHARDDDLITKNRSRTVVNGILQAAGKPTLTFPSDDDLLTQFEFSDEAIGLNYTELATGGHRIWNEVYETPDFERWLFAQAIPEPNSFTLVLSAIALLVLGNRRRCQH